MQAPVRGVKTHPAVGLHESFGFLPVGLFYHACYSVAAAGLMAAMVRYAWPDRLEKEAEKED